MKHFWACLQDNEDLAEYSCMMAPSKQDEARSQSGRVLFSDTHLSHLNRTPIYTHSPISTTTSHHPITITSTITINNPIAVSFHYLQPDRQTSKETITVGRITSPDLRPFRTHNCIEGRYEQSRGTHRCRW